MKKPTKFIVSAGIIALAGITIGHPCEVVFAISNAPNTGVTLPLPPSGNAQGLAQIEHFASPTFAKPEVIKKSISFSLSLPGGMFAFDYELLVQNQQTGAVEALPLQGKNTKSDPSLIRDTLSLPEGHYVISVDPLANETGSPLRVAQSSWIVTQGSTTVKPWHWVSMHRSATGGQIVGRVVALPSSSKAVVLAIPVAAASDNVVAATTNANGQYDIRVPSTGLYNLLAFLPGRGGLALAGVVLLYDRHAVANLRLPQWSNRHYAIVVQRKNAYEGYPVWAWGRAGANDALQFGIYPLPNQGVSPLHQYSITTGSTGFFSSTKNPWSKNFADLTATYRLTIAGKTLIHATLPGVPSGSNGNMRYPANLWPYNLAWSTQQSEPSPPLSDLTHVQQELSTYPTPVRGTIEWTSEHTHYLVGGPTVLPHTELKGYPSAVAQTTPNGWLASVYMTDHSYGTNSPEILGTSKTGVPVHLSNWELGPSWTFGVSRVPVSQLPTMHSEAMDNLLEGLPVNRNGTELWRSWPHHLINLGHGIVGSLYQKGQYTPTLVWEEGDWTFILPDSLGSNEQRIARSMVAYMNVRLLPPAPGVVTVQTGVHGYYANASYLQSGYLHKLSMAGNNETNEAVGVLRMAVHWHTLAT